MFQNDDSDTRKEVDQVNETRSKRVARGQSSPLAHLHIDEAMTPAVLKGEESSGDRQQGNTRAFLHILMLGRR